MVRGFAFKAALTTSTHRATELKRVTGIGGIFFKCKEPAKMRAWYKEHLGLQTNQYGAVFEWRQGTDTLKKRLHSMDPIQRKKTGYFKTV